MDRSAKISVSAGDVEFDLEGSPAEIEERLSHLRHDDMWGLMIDRLTAAKKEAMNGDGSSSNRTEVVDRGMAFRTLIEKNSLNKKPDQVLGALHFLRDVENIMDSPPRIINQLFEDAGIDPPGNLSLYLNRLREREFLVIPDDKDDKNRYAVLTTEGKQHLNKKSTK